MTYLEAIVLSIVEGITEFLPISSTGHLILFASLLNIEQTEFVKSFEIIVQLGAILAVIFLYLPTLLKNKTLWIKVLIAFLPSAVIGLIFYQFIKEMLLGNEVVTIITMFLGGVVLIFYDKYAKASESLKGISDLTYKDSFIIGIFQSFSIIPGVSRSASTIIGGLLKGYDKSFAVEFSFLLAIPTMFAATGLDLIKSSINFSPYEYQLLGIGILVSFLTALIAIKFFLKFVKEHSFAVFGFYRVVLALIFAIRLIS